MASGSPNPVVTTMNSPKTQHRIRPLTFQLTRGYGTVRWSNPRRPNLEAECAPLHFVPSGDPPLDARSRMSRYTDVSTVIMLTSSRNGRLVPLTRVPYTGVHPTGVSKCGPHGTHQLRHTPSTYGTLHTSAAYQGKCGTLCATPSRPCAEDLRILGTLSRASAIAVPLGVAKSESILTRGWIVVGKGGSTCFGKLWNVIEKRKKRGEYSSGRSIRAFGHFANPSRMDYVRGFNFVRLAFSRMACWRRIDGYRLRSGGNRGGRGDRWEAREGA
ncbi:hypothetical protein FB451DRAFT_1185589 [Mycena latifolia]|nr:hypothetical protein FB451DRAFT_1185589 [Mycena latifolia]